MGVFGSSGQVHRHIKKLRWLFRYPRSEPYSMTWLVPHQIKLICGMDLPRICGERFQVYAACLSN